MLRCNAILSFSKRQRKLAPLTIDQLEERALLKKQWAHYKHDERVADFQIIDRLVQAQNKALAELRRESEELYQAAIDIDPQLLPVAVKGPVATPPLRITSVPMATTCTNP